ncbi:bile acid:sodium symporter family protein [Ureibacillus sp. FSL K6-8385]|uniref:Bile acid:sodium symporter family protein n=1 Tax=Ureibacillus terrenus TaxID=118246 RepID=A0A540V0Q5_9BACL|nr:bile acid:sodium symporter family protein [Ureibacillus terrenus]MED3662186.1 bile acid:sodium symporter family protein [Ureibacillus terrenus]MED3765158.1 bile acid:sodium symporter family protein [Ureibacillus terrenus]TQE90350.1 bile acid:sodium symporter family protein [Ureibacillus terrenus]
MLTTFNSYLQKLMPILTPLSLILGVLFEEIGGQMRFLIPWIFAIMTFAGSLSINFQGLRSVKKHPGFILLTIAFLHIFMPIWAYILSMVVFDDHLLMVGFILSVAVPTGVTSFIWVSICKGNLPLGLSIILIDTVLSPVIFPLLSKIAVGRSIPIDTTSIMLDLLWMIVIPSIIGMLVNEKGNAHFVAKLNRVFAPFQKISLFLIVFINSSVIAPYLKHITWEIFEIILLVLVISLSGYTLCLIIGHFLWKKIDLITTFVFTGGMRNIAVGVVIAGTYFPSKVVLPVVFGMLFQQILASQFSKALEKYQERFHLETANEK